MTKKIDVKEHIQIDAVIPDEAGAGYWVHTHGMAQFGKPDLEIIRVRGMFVYAASYILNGVAQKMVDGAEIKPYQTADLGTGVRVVFLPLDDTSHFDNDCLRIAEAEIVTCEIHDGHVH